MSVGDEDAEFAAFMHSAYPSLLRTARLLTGEWYLAEDLVQAALVRVYQQWGKRQLWRSPTAYARRVTLNQYTTWRRRRWMTERIGTEHVQGSVAADARGDADTRAALEAELRRLPRNQRAVLVLRYFEDLSVEECADVLGCSMGTAKSKTNQAIRTLRMTGVFTSTEEGIYL